MGISAIARPGRFCGRCIDCRTTPGVTYAFPYAARFRWRRPGLQRGAARTASSPYRQPAEAHVRRDHPRPALEQHPARSAHASSSSTRRRSSGCATCGSSGWPSSSTPARRTRASSTRSARTISRAARSRCSRSTTTSPRVGRDECQLVARRRAAARHRALSVLARARGDRRAAPRGGRASADLRAARSPTSCVASSAPTRPSASSRSSAARARARCRDSSPARSISTSSTTCGATRSCAA